MRSGSGTCTLMYFFKSISMVVQRYIEDQTQNESIATTKTQKFLTLFPGYKNQVI